MDEVNDMPDDIEEIESDAITSAAILAKEELAVRHEEFRQMDIHLKSEEFNEMLGDDYDDD